MPLITLDGQIEKIKDLEDAKAILRQVVRALNTLYDARHTQGTDIEFPSGKGVIFTSSDGHRVKMIVTGLGTYSVSFMDLGR